MRFLAMVLLLSTAAMVAHAQPRGREPGEPVDISPELATHREVEPLNVTFQRLSALRLRSDGALLAADAGAKQIYVFNADGQQIDTIALDFAPEAFNISPDGMLYCGGQGQLAKLDETGRVLKKVDVPDEVAPTADGRDAGRAAPPAAARRRKKTFPKRVSGIAVTDRDVFVAFGSGWSLGSQSKLYRFDRELGNPRPLADGLRGCCQRCDIVTRDGVLYLAENSAHRVVLYDRDGKVLAKWGEEGRDDLETFGACCNPMNLCFDDAGILYTSESGLGRVKRYTADGKFLNLVGYVGTTRFWHGSALAASCSNIAIAATGDGRRVYVMDYKNNRIRVLEKKEDADATPTR